MCYLSVHVFHVRDESWNPINKRSTREVANLKRFSSKLCRRLKIPEALNSKLKQVELFLYFIVKNNFYWSGLTNYFGSPEEPTADRWAPRFLHFPFLRIFPLPSKEWSTRKPILRCSIRGCSRISVLISIWISEDFPGSRSGWSSASAVDWLKPGCWNETGRTDFTFPDKTSWDLA